MIISRLTIVLALLCLVAKQDRNIAFLHVGNGQGPLMMRSICCQQLLQGEVAMSWLLIHRHALRLSYLRLYLDGERMWSPLVRLTLPKFTSFVSWNRGLIIDLSSERGRLNVGRLSRFFSRTGNAGSDGSTFLFYRGLVETKCDNILGETLASMKINLLICSGGHSDRGQWIISRGRWLGKVTEEPCQFGINSLGTAILASLLAQDVSKGAKLVYTLL